MLMLMLAAIMICSLITKAHPNTAVHSSVNMHHYHGIAKGNKTTTTTTNYLAEIVHSS